MELSVDCDRKLVSPLAWWSGEPPSAAESLFLWLLWNPEFLGSRSSLNVGTGGQLGTHFVYGLIFPPSRTIFFIVLFSQYLKDVVVPLPSYQRDKKCHFSPIYLFQMFPVRWGSCIPGSCDRGWHHLPRAARALSTRVPAEPVWQGAEGEKLPMALIIGREGEKEGGPPGAPAASLLPFHAAERVGRGRCVLSGRAGDAAVP